MKQHKWHKEIKAWADGQKVQWYNPCQKQWIDHDNDEEGEPQWMLDFKWRVKPQPKESQYLYVYKNSNQYYFCKQNEAIKSINVDVPSNYIGKIKLEDTE